MNGQRLHVIPSARIGDKANLVTDEVERIISECENFAILARVLDSARATDFSVCGQGRVLLVIRCVAVPADTDYFALETMLEQGPFTRALLVSAAGAQDQHGALTVCGIDGISGALKAIASEAP